MTTNDELQRIRAHMRRWGQPEKPAAERLVAEVRSHDVFPLMTRDPSREYLIDTILIVWTFGTPKSQFDEVNGFLRDNEVALSRIAELSTTDVGVPTAAYRGTYWTVGMGRYCYTTIWAYADAEAVQRVQDFLANDELDAFKDAYHALRAYWDNDPGRPEHRFQADALLAKS